MNCARFVTCVQIHLSLPLGRDANYHGHCKFYTVSRGRRGASFGSVDVSPSSNGDDDAENWNEIHISLSNDELERYFPDAGIVDMEDEVEWDMCEVFDELSEQHLMLDSSVESSRCAERFDLCCGWCEHGLMCRCGLRLLLRLDMLVVLTCCGFDEADLTCWRVTH